MNQCGYLVRENIPISYPLWKRNSKTDEEADIVPETEKEMLWNKVKATLLFSRRQRSYPEEVGYEANGYLLPDIQETLDD